jgi:hypothetical protein
LQQVWADRFARDGVQFVQRVLPDILKDLAGVDAKIDVREIPKGLSEAMERLVKEQEDEDENSAEKNELLTLFDKAKAAAEKAGLEDDDDEKR